MAQKTISRFRKFQARVQSVLDEMGIISRNESEMHWLEKLAHFSVMVIKSFWRNRCPVRASALAYTTLLALVPLLAVAISISTSFFKQKGNEQQITQLIDTLVAKVAPQLDLVSRSQARPLTPEQKKSQTELLAEMLAKYDTNQNRHFDPEERKNFSEEDSNAMLAVGIGQMNAREKVAENISTYI